MYIGTDTTYYSGTLAGIRNRTWGKIISLNFVDERQQIIRRRYIYRKFDEDKYPVKRTPSDLGFDYIKRKTL